SGKSRRQYVIKSASTLDRLRRLRPFRTFTFSTCSTFPLLPLCSGLLYAHGHPRCNATPPLRSSSNERMIRPCDEVMIMKRALSMLLALIGSGLLLTAQVKDFRPVTEAMLRNPSPGDWLNWRRTDNAWGYSPLEQINRQNAQELQLAWSWSMDDTG